MTYCAFEEWIQHLNIKKCYVYTLNGATISFTVVFRWGVSAERSQRQKVAVRWPHYMVSGFRNDPHKRIDGKKSRKQTREWINVKYSCLMTLTHIEWSICWCLHVFNVWGIDIFTSASNEYFGVANTHRYTWYSNCCKSSVKISMM